MGQLVAAAAEEVLPVATEAQLAELAVEVEHVAAVAAETFAFAVEAAGVEHVAAVAAETFAFAVEEAAAAAAAAWEAPAVVAADGSVVDAA